MDPSAALATLVSHFSSTQTFTPFPTGGNLSGLGIFLVIIVIVVIRRIMYAVRGRRYSSGRVLSLPVIYLILTVVTIIPLEIQNSIALASLLTLPVGFAIGYAFGRQASFFYKGGMLYYKRSPVVLIIWLISYVSRLFLLFVLYQNFRVLFIVDAVIALTAGMIIGEAIHVLRKHDQFTGSEPRKDEGSNDDFEMMKEM